MYFPVKYCNDIIRTAAYKFLAVRRKSSPAQSMSLFYVYMYKLIFSCFWNLNYFMYYLNPIRFRLPWLLYTSQRQNQGMVICVDLSAL